MDGEQILIHDLFILFGFPQIILKFGTYITWFITEEVRLFWILILRVARHAGHQYKRLCYR